MIYSHILFRVYHQLLLQSRSSSSDSLLMTQSFTGVKSTCSTKTQERRRVRGRPRWWCGWVVPFLGFRISNSCCSVGGEEEDFFFAAGAGPSIFDDKMWATFLCRYLRYLEDRLIFWGCCWHDAWRRNKDHVWDWFWWFLAGPSSCPCAYVINKLQLWWMGASITGFYVLLRN